MEISFRTTISIFFIFFIVLSIKSSVCAKDYLTWTGCGITKKAFMAEVSKAYEQATGIKIKLSGGGATKGIRFVNSKLSDLGGHCRPALVNRFKDEEGMVFMVVVAWDALVPIVHKDNPIDSIAIQLQSSGPVEKKVESEISAIAIAGISSAKKRNVKILAIDGKKATSQNIASGVYSTFRPLYISYALTAKMSKTKAFIAWILSDAGQEIIEKNGTVSLRMGIGLKDRFKYWTNTNKIVNFSSLP